MPGFHIRTVQGAVVRCLFDVLKDLLGDALLVFDQDGVRISTIEDMKCMIVHMKLEADSFEKYECDGRYEIGINTANMFKLIQAASGKDAITLSYDAATPHKLGICIQNFERNSTTSFSLNLIDLEYEDIELDDVDFECKVTMPSKYFQRLCKDMSDIAKNMRIQSKDGIITLGCDGDFASQRTVLGVTDKDVALDWSEGAVFDAVFDLKYLLTICKSTGLSPTVELYMKQNVPLVVVYNIAALGILKLCLIDKIVD